MSATISFIIDTKLPIEADKFAAQLLAIVNQYERNVRDADTSSQENKIYIQKIESGSIIVSLMATIEAFVSAADQTKKAIEFVRWISKGITPFLKKGGRNSELKTRDLRDFYDLLATIATAPDANMYIRALSYSDGEKTTTAEFAATDKEAKQALKNINDEIVEREERSAAQYNQVALYFFQTNLEEPQKDKKSKERAIVETISDKPLPVVYASSMAGQHIKSEISSGYKNPYKLIFIVDLNVETVRGQPVAYRIINLHKVLEQNNLNEQNLIEQ